MVLALKKDDRKNFCPWWTIRFSFVKLTKSTLLKSKETLCSITETETLSLELNNSGFESPLDKKFQSNIACGHHRLLLNSLASCGRMSSINDSKDAAEAVFKRDSDIRRTPTMLDYFSQ